MQARPDAGDIACAAAARTNDFREVTPEMVRYVRAQISAKVSDSAAESPIQEQCGESPVIEVGNERSAAQALVADATSVAQNWMRYVQRVTDQWSSSRIARRGRARLALRRRPRNETERGTPEPGYPRATRIDREACPACDMIPDHTGRCRCG